MKIFKEDINKSIKYIDREKKSKFYTFIKKVFAPKKFTCFFCKREVHNDQLWCKKCREHIKYVSHPCNKCGRETNENEQTCKSCRKSNFAFDRGTVMTTYTHGIAYKIHEMKYGGKPAIALFFGEMLKEFFEPKRKYDYITYVPMTKKSFNQRGYNQTTIVAKMIGDKFNIELYDNIVKVKKTKNQHGLKMNERAKNIKGSFRATTRLDKKSVLVIDDVLTTGSTMNEMAVALKKKGAEYVDFLTISATRLNK